MNKTTELKTILSTFTCDESDPRVFLREPFNYGEYTYFTDGNVMVRIPKEEGHQELPEEKKENYHNAINKLFCVQISIIQAVARRTRHYNANLYRLWWFRKIDKKRVSRV